MDEERAVWQGAFFLSVAAIICKILGASYRIPLARLIGDEGIGLYQSAYPLYLTFFNLSTAGLPLAVSRLVAERAAIKDREGIRRILRLALGLLGGLGIFGGIFLFGAARFFSVRIMADPRTYPVLVSLAPAIPLMALTAAWRGFLQGLQKMEIAALSQLLEQIVRVGSLLGLAYLLLPSGLTWAAAGAAFGATTGGVAGLIFLVYWYYRYRAEILAPFPSSRESPSYGFLARRLLQSALPIAFGALLFPLMQTLDSFLVPNRLQALGYPVGEAMAALGRLGNAWAVIYVPTTVTGALATSLLPAVTAAWAREKSLVARHQVRQAIRLTVFLCLPGAVGLYVLAEEICLLLYGSTSAAEMLRSLAPVAFFLGLQTVSAGALQGIDRVFSPAFHLALGFLLKAWLGSFLLPVYGPRGAALASVAGTGLTAALNLAILEKSLGFSKNEGKFFLQTTLAGGIMGLLLHLFLPAGRLSPLLTLLFALPGGAFFFVGLLWLLGGVKPEDVELLRRLGKAEKDYHLARVD